MQDLIFSIVTKVAEYSTPVRQQLVYLIFLEKKLKKLTDQLTEIERARDDTKQLIDAERRKGKILEDVQKWLDRVDGVIEAAQELQQDPYLENTGCSRCLAPKLMRRRWQLSREAKKMAKVVIPDLQGQQKFERISYLPALDGVGSLPSAGGNEKLESRKLIEEDIVQSLRDLKICKIGVYGLAGVGKTTLVKQIAKRAKQCKLFDEVVMATVSRTPDLKTIQGEIADLLGLRFEEETIAGRAFRLCKRIKAEKSILIILDDIWAQLDFEKLGIPSAGEHNVRKLLMTSRNQDVLQKMEVQQDFGLDLLREEETWSLFEFMAGNVVQDINLKTAIEVATKCAG